MTETKNEKFVRLRDARLPKILHALDVLSNLGGSAYEASDAEYQDVIEKLDAAVDQVAEAFGIPAPDAAAVIDTGVSQALTKPLSNEEMPSSVPAAETSDDEAGHGPGSIVEGGGTALGEVSWAYDAVKRKDWKLAENRLSRIMKAWKS